MRDLELSQITVHVLPADKGLNEQLADYVVNHENRRLWGFCRGHQEFPYLSLTLTVRSLVPDLQESKKF